MSFKKFLKAFLFIVLLAVTIYFSIDIIQKKNNFIYLDYYSKMKEDLSLLTYDGLHPNEKGYLKMNAIIKKSLKGITNNFN